MQGLVGEDEAAEADPTEVLGLVKPQTENPVTKQSYIHTKRYYTENEYINKE